MQTLQQLPPIVAIVLGLVALAWLVFAFLVPFMIDSIRRSSRKTHAQLEELNRRIDALSAALHEVTARNPGSPEAGSPDTSPARKQPPGPNTRSMRTEPAPRHKDRTPPTRKAPQFGSDETSRATTSRSMHESAPRGRQEPTISNTRLAPDQKRTD